MLMLAAAGGLVAFGFLAFPPVIRDLQQFGHEMPTRLPAFLDKLKHIPFADQVNTDEVATKIEDFISNAATYLLLSIKNWAGAIFGIAMGVILTVYFILEGDVAYRWALSFFPAEKRVRLDAALQRAEVRMGKWLLGQGSLMLILGLTSTIVFVMLHVRYAYALGVLTGLLNIIPVIGAAASIALALAGRSRGLLGTRSRHRHLLRCMDTGGELVPGAAHHGHASRSAGVVNPGGTADWIGTGWRPWRYRLGSDRRAGVGAARRIPGSQRC